MVKEFVAPDKVHLLMEETGCDQGQAELAMSSAGYDVEKAIRTIGTLLRHITAVRAKFSWPEKNLYGLMILVADTKRKALLRRRVVVSYNPALFETALDRDWYDFERQVYAFRLSEGTLQQVTQDLEGAVLDNLEGEQAARFFENLTASDPAALREQVAGVIGKMFPGAALDVALSREELNRNQFQRVKVREDDMGASAKHDGVPASSDILRVAISLEEDAAGFPARDVQVGDSVQVLLTDERDIAQYLSKLLGGRRGDAVTPLAAPVEEVARKRNKMQFHVRLSAGILGLAEVPEDRRVKIQRAAPAPWWRRWVSP